MDRRAFLGGMALLGVPYATHADEAFSAQTVIGLAQDLAARPWQPAAEVPQAWQDLTYDQYRLFWFNTQKALWRDTGRPAEVDFFLPGLYFPRPVMVHQVVDGIARPVPFDLSLFDRTDQAPALPEDETLGYSGFRLRGELAEPGVFQEYAVFQGASYLRAIGQGQVYGLSARGLALNTADKAGEEFPDFRAFWIEAPAPGDRRVVVHALLDGPSVAGAYRFAIEPGPATVMEVEAVLFPRVALAHVGLGPLTSMFLFDGTNRSRFDDFRPQVHDSDGLLIHNGMGEVLWRPLANPRLLQVSSFVDDNPRGFGLMQRNRRLSDFADLEAQYHQRPGLWVQPGEGWGRGAVTLVEIPSDREIYDNIVAYWRPREALPAGVPHRMTYRLTWALTPPAPRDVARVLDTRMGASAFREGITVAIDYAEHPLLAGDPATVQVHVSSNGGTLRGGQVQRNPETGGLRLGFGFDPGGAKSLELRAQLLRDGAPASEVWLYRWTP